jgi:hypothetical protein
MESLMPTWKFTFRREPHILPTERVVVPEESFIVADSVDEAWQRFLDSDNGAFRWGLRVAITLFGPHAGDDVPTRSVDGWMLAAGWRA